MTRFFLAALCLTTLTAATRADADADLKALIDKGVKSLGSDDRLARYKGATWKGKGDLLLRDAEVEFTGEWAALWPAQSRSRLELNVGGMTFPIVRVLNGDKGWMKQGDGDVTDLDKDGVAQERSAASLYHLLTMTPLKDAKAFTLKAGGEEMVNGKPTLVVVVTPKAGGREVTILLDKETGLPAKVKAKVKDPMAGGDVEQVMVYADYKEVDGIKRAMTTTVFRDGKKYGEVKLSEFKPVEKLDAKLFDKP